MTELTEGKVDPVASDADSVFPVQDVSTLLTDPNGSLEDFLNSWSDMASWDLDLPADMPPPVQPKLEEGVGRETADRPLPVYGNRMMNPKQQPVDQRYQVSGNWPQPPPPHQITPQIRPGSLHVGNGRMHPMSAGPPSNQQYNGVQQGPTGLTHNTMEIRSHLPPSQPCARQTVVPFGNMQPCQQREVPVPHQFLQVRPPMMSNHVVPANHVRSLSPGLQHSMVPNQPAMMHGGVSAATMSNQLHNLQAMVNNTMLHHSHVNMSPGLGPSAGDPLMHAKMHRNSTRGMHGSRHGDARLFQSAEYQPPPNIMHQHLPSLSQNVGSLQDQSAGMVAHPAAAGFHRQSSVPPLQHTGLRGPAGQQSHAMPNHTGMMANHPSMMPTQPELRPNHFSGRSHGMGVMSPTHRGMVHSSGPVRNQMGMPSQQMMMLKQQPMQMQHLSRNTTMQQSQMMMDKNVSAFQWHSPGTTPNMMAQPAGVQNVAQARNSPAVNQFPSTVGPTAGSNDQLLSSGQNNASFSADIDSLSFLSDPFLSQVSDDGYGGQQQMLQSASVAGIEHVVECNIMILRSYYYSLLVLCCARFFCLCVCMS